MNNVTQKQMEDHLLISRYGDFQLTDGIRPDIGSVPMQGFKHMMYKDVPCTLGCISKEFVLEVFYEMLDLMDGEVFVVLESSHDRFTEDGHYDYCRDGIDLSVLRSILVDYEDLIVDDGQFGIAIFAFTDGNPIEVQLDEHKSLIGYGNCGDKFDQIFEMYGLVCNEGLQSISEMDHIHISSDVFYDKFLELKNLLGIDE